MNDVLHLYFGHHELDVLFVSDQVLDNFIIVVRELRNFILHLYNLLLGLVLAASDVLVESLDDLVNLGDALDQICVVARHQGINCISDILQEGALVTEALGKVIEVFFPCEFGDESGSDASNLVTFETRLVRHLRPRNASFMAGHLLWEHAEGESLSGFFVLAVLVKLHSVGVSHIGLGTKADWFNLSQTVVLEDPVVRLSEQIEQLKSIPHDHVESTHA